MNGTDFELAQDSAAEQISALVGAEDLKVLAKELCAVAPQLRARGILPAFMYQSYLFSMENGGGYTTCLQLFSRLLCELGLFSRDGEPAQVVEVCPPAQSANNRDPLGEALDPFRRFRGEGIVYSVDLRHWLSDLQNPLFRTYLSALATVTSRNIIVFRVPPVGQTMIGQLTEILSDIHSIRVLTFPPFSPEQLREGIRRILLKYGYTVREDAWDTVDARIAEEKSDGRFYGLNTLNKIAHEMLYDKALRCAECRTSDRLICPEDLSALVRKRAVDGGMPALSEMVGMEQVRAVIEEAVSHAEFARRNGLPAPCLHMRFVGAPGTGKTTIARLVGQIFKERGLLRNGNFFEYHGRDFCGKFIGETAQKTSSMCRDAYGSVLFIDEAYTLYRSEDNEKDYGREALDTLLAEMENHRQDMVVIMAGYPAEMDLLMKANPGLESRMPYLVEFPNYDRAQLCEIFLHMIRDPYTAAPGLDDAVRDYFDGLPEEMLRDKSFGNVRFVRNLYERTCSRSELRCHYEDGAAQLLTVEDFRSATAESGFSWQGAHGKHPIGF